VHSNLWQEEEEEEDIVGYQLHESPIEVPLYKLHTHTHMHACMHACIHTHVPERCVHAFDEWNKDILIN